MFTWLVNWFIGSRDYSVDDIDADRAASIIAMSGANFRRMRRREKLYFTVSLPDCALLERILKSRDIAYNRLHEHGLEPILRRYRHRYGVPVGIGMFIAILLLSSRFIWSMEVAGNERISDDEVLARLEELGCSVGTYIPSIDFDKLHTDYLLKYDDTAWIAVNVSGTKATVELREIVTNPPVPDEDIPYNLVAAEDGIIESLEIYRGDPVVEPGLLVRKGELLVSGIRDFGERLGLVHARGRVIARVTREFTIEVPLEREVRIATGTEYSEKYLKILGFSIKFSGNTGNLPADCDKIVRESDVMLFDTLELPVSVEETIYREYTTTTEQITEDEAKTEAYRQLRERMTEILADGELVSREIESGLVDGKYVISCRLELLRDIALESEIYR